MKMLEATQRRNMVRHDRHETFEQMDGFMFVFPAQHFGKCDTNRVIDCGHRLVGEPLRVQLDELVEMATTNEDALGRFENRRIEHGLARGYLGCGKRGERCAIVVEQQLFHFRGLHQEGG